MKKFTLVVSMILLFITTTIPQEKWPPAEFTLGMTKYDLQTERTMQNRIFVYNDGTIGVVWNMGNQDPDFPDLGIGYNYFDGAAWSPYPYQSITSGIAKNPSYTDFGENGEICVSQGLTGLYINVRDPKGTGTWQEAIMPGDNLRHPVVVTTGPEDQIIHLLYLKADTTFTPNPAQHERGFLWYARSSDQGTTWDLNQPMNGIGPDDYQGFTTGAYCWAEPNGDDLAFLAGDYLTDLVLMKSIDGGDNWQKTIVWEHPYPMFEIFTFDSDTFYCNGGSMSAVIDDDDMVHVAFGLSRVYSSTEQDTAWFDPYVGGIAYWREDMPSFKNTLNSLDPDSLSVCDNLIAWPQDVNGNGNINILPPGEYPTLGLLSMPDLVISDWGFIYLIFSAVTETYDNGIENYRHLWIRQGNLADCSWDNFVDLNADIVHIFDECFFPDVASKVNDNIKLVYQIDHIPGNAISGEIPFTDNDIQFMQVDLPWNSKADKGVFVDFKVNLDSIFEGDTVHFRNLSCGCPYPVSYLWNFEGGDPMTSNEQNPEVIYYTAGTYDVELIIDNGVNTGSQLKPDYITVYTKTSVRETFAGNGIQLFPNPTSGIIGIRIQKTGSYLVKVRDLTGRTVFEEKQNSSFQTLDMSSYSNGIYFFEIENGEETYFDKIVLRK